MIHPNAIIHVKLNGHNVTEERMYRTLAFLMIFLCVYVAGVFVLMFCGFDFISSATTSIACLSTLGPGLELTYPVSSFAEISTAGKWVCSFLMLLGRLELYSVLILFSIAFWRKK
jgi:trk system potassium uptake protein TrkH